MHKECSKCGIVKELNCENFYKRSSASSKDGYCGVCKVCRKKQDQERYNAKRDEIKKQKKEYYKRTAEIRRDWAIAYRKRNKEETLAYAKEYREKNRESIANKRRQRRQTDPIFRIRCDVSSKIAHAIKEKSADKKSKGGKTFEHLPYTPQQLKEHIESQFEDWMTWDNHGDWHIDHIYPQSKLPYDSLEHPNFQKCWALENLRPLSAKENLKKSNKIIS
jgi:hypothetical protein|tara:strand:- start:50 stop:709 length:660 start_codon:yes stop_codon:yes gene_type:complete